MNELFLIGNRLPDVILGFSVIRIPETVIDDAVLDVYEKRLFTKIPLLRRFQKPDEILSPGGAWPDEFDLEGGLGFLAVKTSQGAPEQFQRIDSGNRFTSFLQVDFFHGGQFIGPPNGRTEIPTAKQIVDDSLALNTPAGRSGIISVCLQKLNVKNIVKIKGCFKKNIK